MFLCLKKCVILQRNTRDMALRRLVLCVLGALLLVSCGENKAQKQAQALPEHRVEESPVGTGDNR